MYDELLMLIELHKAGSFSSKTLNFVIDARENCIMPKTLSWAEMRAMAHGPLTCGVVISTWVPSAAVGGLELR